MNSRKHLLWISVIVLLAIPALVMADDMAAVDKNLTAANISKLEAGETILLDQTYTDEKGQTRGKGLAIVLVNKPPDDVFTYIGQFGSYPEFMPRMVKSTVYKNEGSSVGAEYTLKVAWKTITYSCLHDVNNGNKTVSWVMDTGRKSDIASTTGMWILKPHKGNTILAYTVAVDTGMAVPKMIQDYLTKKDLPNVVRAMKKRVESGGTYKKTK